MKSRCWYKKKSETAEQRQMSVKSDIGSYHVGAGALLQLPWNRLNFPPQRHSNKGSFWHDVYRGWICSRTVRASGSSGNDGGAVIGAGVREGTGDIWEETQPCKNLGEWLAGGGNNSARSSQMGRSSECSRSMTTAAAGAQQIRIWGVGDEDGEGQGHAKQTKVGGFLSVFFPNWVVCVFYIVGIITPFQICDLQIFSSIPYVVFSFWWWFPWL